MLELIFWTLLRKQHIETNDFLEQELDSLNLNALVTVAALGFDHIAPTAFINAFNRIEKDGYVAFTIRDKFLTHRDETGYRSGR